MRLFELLPKPLATLVKIVLTIAALEFILGHAAMLRYPILDEVICDPDVAGAMYSSQFLFEDGSVYAHGIETKPPLTYFLYNLMFRIFGKSLHAVGIFSIAYHLACTLALFFLGMRLFGLIGGLTSAYIYGYYSAISTANGLCFNFETWTILPVILATLAVLYAFTMKVQRKSLLFAAGALAAVAVLFKQQAAAYVIVIGIAVVAETVLTPRNRMIASLPAAIALYVAGGIAVTAPVIAFFAWKHGLTAMWEALNPRHYATYATTEDFHFLQVQLKESLLEFIGNARNLLFLAFVGALPVGKRREEIEEERSRGPYLFGAYGVGTLVAVFAGTKFYDHYFLLLIPLLALLVGRLVGRAWESERVHWLLKIAAIAVVIAATMQDLKLERALAQDARDQIRTTGRVYYTEDSDFVWRKTPVPRYSALSHRARALGECIKSHGKDGDALFVWDYIPHIYFYSGMRAPTRHFMYFEVAVDLPRGHGRWHSREDDYVIASRKELMEDLRRRKPLDIVMYKLDRADTPGGLLIDHAPLFTELKIFLDNEYAPDPYCADPYFLVYRRKDRVN